MNDEYLRVTTLVASMRRKALMCYRAGGAWRLAASFRARVALRYLADARRIRLAR